MPTPRDPEQELRDSAAQMVAIRRVARRALFAVLIITAVVFVGALVAQVEFAPESLFFLAIWVGWMIYMLTKSDLLGKP
jgi:uncharacterized membrane protein YccC